MGNRTRRTLDSVQTDFTYGGGNREATVSGGAAPLTYDYKGNVTARQPLAGGDTYHYEYDEFDRLIECNGSGAVNFPTTRYNYDATGRLLARRGNVGEQDESTMFFYWVGLNCLAVERPTDEMVESIDTVTWWPDREVEDAPERNGWAVYDAQGGESMAYVEDGSPDARGTVLHLTATGGTAPFNGQFIIGDNYSDVANPNDLPFDPEWMDFRLGVRVRNASAETDKRFRLTALAETDTGSRVLMTFISGDGVDVSDGACRYFYMGTHLNDDAWHELDLPLDDLLTSLTGETLSAVTGLVVSANDLYLDGFHPEVGAMIASYQLIPGAAIGGVLACEYPTAVAPPGGPIVMPAWTEYYYHYNDLGTVVGVTDIYGETVTVGVPDFFGNYRFTVGERATALIPDSSGTYHTIYVDQMGLTGKFHDPDTGLYYFGARWYDAERGRWMSEEPFGLKTGGVSFYVMCMNDPAIFLDSDGNAPKWVHNLPWVAKDTNGTWYHFWTGRRGKLATGATGELTFVGASVGLNFEMFFQVDTYGFLPDLSTLKWDGCDGYFVAGASTPFQTVGWSFLGNVAYASDPNASWGRTCPDDIESGLFYEVTYAPTGAPLGPVLNLFAAPDWLDGGFAGVGLGVGGSLGTGGPDSSGAPLMGTAQWYVPFSSGKRQPRVP